MDKIEEILKKQEIYYDLENEIEKLENMISETISTPVIYKRKDLDNYLDELIIVRKERVQNLRKQLRNILHLSTLTNEENKQEAPNELTSSKSYNPGPVLMKFNSISQKVNSSNTPGYVKMECSQENNDFICKVKTNQITYTARSTSKKKAKAQAAALYLINKHDIDCSKWEKC